MKVRLTTDRIGPGGYQPSGSVIVVSESEGCALLASNQADPVDGEQLVETASLKAGRRGRPRMRANKSRPEL